jgi:hypothetical protein
MSINKYPRETKNMLDNAIREEEGAKLEQTRRTKRKQQICHHQYNTM